MFGIGSIIKAMVEGVVGPLFGWLNKKEDTSLEKFKVNGQVDQSLIAAHIAGLQVKRDLLLAQQKYFGGRMMQYIFVYPLGFWWTSIVFYCIFHPYFPQIKPVLALPDNLNPWAFAMISFLFLTSKVDTWVRRT